MAREKTKNELQRRILQLLQKEKKGFSPDKLASLLRTPKKERARLILTLTHMQAAGDIELKKNGKYVMKQNNAILAQMVSLSSGFGFARPNDGGQDVFIPGRDLNEALPGDTVRLIIGKKDERGPAGAVTQIVEQGPRLYSGRFVNNNNEWTIVPDAQIRYPLPVRKGAAQAGNGDKVRFSAEYTKSGELIARVMTAYGEADSAKVCADAIIDTAGIPSRFSTEVRQSAVAVMESSLSKQEIASRLDLRDEIVFTIDGADAKDLDDAISLEPIDDGWLLGVHIADVSYYVRENTPLDAEARRRGTSVYFADRVIPMLPEEISNGVCSLNAGEDKLTLSCIMQLNEKGELQKSEIRKSIIHSCVRGVYQEINRLFDGEEDEALIDKYAPVWPVLQNMRELAGVLRHAAQNRGTMDLISHEAAFLLDDKGHPMEIRNRVTGESEQMIEQFMISANVAVAAFARKKELPFVYRVHESPDPAKLQVLSEIAHNLNLKSFRLNTQGDMRNLLEEAKATPYARLISDRLLRSMAKARYSEMPLGHYGLSLKDYCHFTSPIRRYPDLSIHRILSDVLNKVPKEKLQTHYTSFVQQSAELSSQFEIRAMTAERQCEDCYKAEYMARFIGEEFEGVVSSVSSFGIFVELENTVEGLIRMEQLPESFLRYDDIASLVDSLGRKYYTIGDTLTIRVENTDVSTGRIDFSLVQRKV